MPPQLRNHTTALSFFSAITGTPALVAGPCSILAAEPSILLVCEDSDRDSLSRSVFLLDHVGIVGDKADRLNEGCEQSFREAAVVYITGIRYLSNLKNRLNGTSKTRYEVTIENPHLSTSRHTWLNGKLLFPISQ